MPLPLVTKPPTENQPPRKEGRFRAVNTIKGVPSTFPKNCFLPLSPTSWRPWTERWRKRVVLAHGGASAGLTGHGKARTAAHRMLLAHTRVRANSSRSHWPAPQHLSTLGQPCHRQARPCAVRVHLTERHKVCAALAGILFFSEFQQSHDTLQLGVLARSWTRTQRRAVLLAASPQEVNFNSA